MRIRHMLLVENEGRFFFEGEPFTGMSYELEKRELSIPKSCRVLRVRTILGGVTVQTEEPSKENDLIALGNRETSNGEFDGKPITGAEFGFDDHGILTTREALKNGTQTLLTVWHTNGVLQSEMASDDEYHWDEEGVLESVLHKGIDIHFFSGAIRSIVLGADYDKVALARYPLVAFEEVRFGRGGFDDEVLAQFSGLSNVTSLVFEKTNLTGSALYAFATSPIEELIIEGQTKITDEEINAFLATKPGCVWHDHRQFE